MAKLNGKWIEDRAVDYNHILVSNDQFIIGRNDLDTLDLNMFKINTANLLEFGIEPIYALAPTLGTSLVNKDYVDQACLGLRDMKDAARLMATGNVDISTAPANIDNVAVANGDRIALTNQTDPIENGLYIYNGVGVAMTRSTDADEDIEVSQGMSFMVVEGDINASKVMMLTTADPIVVGTTALNFVQIPSLGNLLAFRNPVVTISAADVTNGYIDLGHEADTGSLSINVIGGPLQEKGLDFTLSTVALVTRITFANDLLLLADTDKLAVSYVYQP